MAGTLRELLESVWAAGDDGAAHRRSREALAEAVRESLYQRLLAEGLTPADADDAAQEKTTIALGWLVAGRVEAGREDAFLRVTAYHAACDAHRKTRRARTVPLPEDPSVAEGLIARSRGRAAADTPAPDEEIVEAVRRVLLDPEMPSTYRSVLEERYLQGRSVETLADDELRRSPVDRQGRPRSREAARATVDQRLSRARNWVRDRLATGPSAVRPPDKGRAGGGDA